MTLCPIAIIAGCNKCPAVSVCPLKGTLGDYKKPEETAKAGGSGAASRAPANKGK